MLWSWKHAWIPHIAEMRMEFMKHFLEYVSYELTTRKNAVFILNRFHISFALFNLTAAREKDYAYILEILKHLPTKIYVPTITSEEIMARSTHKERPLIWDEHLHKRMKQQGFTSITDMYVAEQKRILALVEAQNIPFETLRTTLR